MTRQRCHHLDRSANAHARIAACLSIAITVGMLASGLTGCVRYSSNRDHLERDALVLSPTNDSTGTGAGRSTAGVRN